MEESSDKNQNNLQQLGFYSQIPDVSIDIEQEGNTSTNQDIQQTSQLVSGAKPKKRAPANGLDHESQEEAKVPGNITDLQKYTSQEFQKNTLMPQNIDYRNNSPSKLFKEAKIKRRIARNSSQTTEKGTNQNLEGEQLSSKKKHARKNQSQSPNLSDQMNSKHPKVGLIGLLQQHGNKTLQTTLQADGNQTKLSIHSSPNNQNLIETPPEVEERNKMSKVFSSKPDSTNQEEQDDIYEKSEMSTINEVTTQDNLKANIDKMTGDKLMQKFKKIIQQKVQIIIDDKKAYTKDPAPLEVKNKNFHRYSNLFLNFTNRREMNTCERVIIDIIINQIGDRVVCLLKQSDTRYIIKQYDMETYQSLNHLEIQGNYIKANKIEQNEQGDMFSVAYLDDGNWRFVVFNFTDLIVDFDVNSYFNIDNSTIPVMGFSQPFSTCCFLKNNLIFYNFFHRPTKTHHHFIYNPVKKVIVKQKQMFEMDKCTNKNFPQRAYFDSEKNLIYILYRQGLLCTIQSDNPDNFIFEKISDQAIGDNFMFKNKIFITESTQQILFFKKQFVQKAEKYMWIKYFTIDSSGFISGHAKINNFQVIEDANIKLFEIDEDSGIPTLQNVMVNFMQANMVNFGVDGQFCIQYKRSHENFFIFKKMLNHDFKSVINHNNFEGAHGISVDGTSMIIVAKAGTLYAYDDHSFELVNTVDLNLEQSNTREPLEIISMNISHDCKYIAIIIGKQLIKDEELITKMVIMRVDSKAQNSDQKHKHFGIFKTINMETYELTSVCKKLHFDKTDSSKLIFVNSDQIITFNFVTETKDIQYDFANDFTEQPEFFVFNDDQDVCIIASTIDTLLINLNNYDEVDLDLIYGIKDIKKLIFDDRYFYILANNKKGMIGNFLLKLEQDKSSKFAVDDQEDAGGEFLLASYTKLFIGDCDMCIRRGENRRLANKQLLLSYKSIYINAYSVFVLDLQTGILIFRHESSCLWESNITSFFVKRSKDYISLSAEGMSVMSLHGTQQKKHVMDDRHRRHLVHSLPSCNYLKLERSNSIRFECSNERRILSVQNQYRCGAGYTKFEDIYKLDLSQLELRELLILQSIFHSDETLVISNLIKSQGNYSLFFRSYLELDGQNMVSILAFDNNTVRQLLQPEHEAYFRADYPLFYSNKQLAQICAPDKRPRKGYVIRNAIDTALEANKIRAVGMILDHIVTHQNNYVSSYLFSGNLTKLMERGIKVHRLLDSDVFSYKFQYPEWPAAHTDVRKIIKPYNGSIFDIRHSYASVFAELGDPLSSAHAGTGDRFYKITYTLNLLPRIERTDTGSSNSFTKLCEDRTCQDLQVFSSTSLQELIYFKWRTHAFALHYFGALMHAIYILVISVYIYNTYLIGVYGECTNAYLPVLMGLGIVYPFLYDAYQLYQQGSEYLEDPWNYADLLFHWSSILNVVFQVTYEPWHAASTITMSLVIALALVKTMFFLRIFDNLAYLVTLIREVIYDLRVFMLLYVILVYMFSLILGVLGWQNYTRDAKQWSEMQESMKYPGVEYHHIGRFLGNIVTVARMSIGDNDFAASHYMSDHTTNLLVWLLWAGLLFIMVIIFLNFIIAEACASYEKVRKNLDSFLQYQKLTLINESEDMMSPSLKTKKRFPMYLIVREVEH